MAQDFTILSDFLGRNFPDLMSDDIAAHREPARLCKGTHIFYY